MSTLYTSRDTIIPYRAESVHFWGLVNSATKKLVLENRKQYAHSSVPQDTAGVTSTSVLGFT